MSVARAQTPVRGAMKKSVAVLTTALMAIGLSVTAAMPANAAAPAGTVFTAVASCLDAGGAQVALTYTNPKAFWMLASGGFGDPTNYSVPDVDSYEVIGEGPMNGQVRGPFYEDGRLSGGYDGSHFAVKNGTSTVVYNVAEDANGGSIKFGYVVKSGAERNWYIPPQEITVNTNCVASNEIVVRDVDLKASETAATYTSWHEGKSVKTSSVKPDGLYFGSTVGSTTIKGTTVHTDPDANAVTETQLKALINSANFTLTSGSVNFQVPVRFGPGLTGFTTLMSENFTTAGTHSLSLNSTWRTSKAFGSYSAFGSDTLDNLLDSLYSAGVSGSEVWTAGFGVQSNTASVVPSLVWNDTKYLFQQPVTQTCTSAVGPMATNQNSQGWKFGNTGTTSWVNFVSNGVNLKTSGWTQQDKASLERTTDIALKDVGVPAINYDHISGVAPGMQMGVDFDNDGDVDAWLIGEDVYMTAGVMDFWLDGGTAAIEALAPVNGGGNGSQFHGTLDQWLVPFPDARVLSVDLAIGRYAKGESLVHSFDFGCVNYSFGTDSVYDAPASIVDVNDSQIAPFEDANPASATYNYQTWHEGHQNANRAYSTKSNGLHLGDGANSQITKGFSSALDGTNTFESLITSAGANVVSGSVTFQIPITYGTTNRFTTIRSLDLGVGNTNFAVTDTWVSTKRLFDNDGNEFRSDLYSGVGGNGTKMPMADLMAFLKAQGNVNILGVGVNAVSAAVIQDLVFNGTQYHFVPTPGKTCDVPDFGNGNYEVHLGRGMEERNSPATFNINSFGGLVAADDPSDTLAEIQAQDTGWTNTYIRSGIGDYTITYTFAEKIVTGTVTVEDGCVTLVWTSVDTPDMTAGTPTITGNALVGSTLTANAGASGWTPATGANFTYQWNADGVAMSGATNLTYTLTAAELNKKITVTVSGSAIGYRPASVTSAETASVVLPTIVAGAPSISGPATVGKVLTANANASGWNPASGVAFGYVWKAGGTVIAGATTSAYTLTAAELGKTITVTVTGSKTNYVSAFATSAPTAAVKLPAIVAGMPKINGTAMVGQMLTANAYATPWIPGTGLEFGYVWKVNGNVIPGATMAAYTLTADDLGKTITVVVTGSKTGYTSASATSLPTSAVAKGVIAPPTATIRGTAEVGKKLTAGPQSTPPNPTDAQDTYQWLSNGSPIAGATSSDYTLTPADLGKTISLEVTRSLRGYAPGAATSLGTTSVINDHLVVTRIAGLDRYETAAKVAQKWESASVVYIATGLGFADALSAGPVAASKDAPLLLTPTSALSSAAKAELMKLKPATIVIVGGTGAVSASVEAELKALSFNPVVNRIGGIDRYETSRMLVEKTFAAGTVDSAYLATGLDFPDALTASPAAAHFGGPVLLVRGTSTTVDAATMALLNKLGVAKVKIAGGEGVMTPAIATQLKAKFGAANVTRNSGNDRYATAVKVNANEFTKALTVYLATGTGFADALAGSALAGMEGAPLFISQPTCIPQAVKTAIDELGATSLVLLGGTGALSSNVENLGVCK